MNDAKKPRDLETVSAALAASATAFGGSEIARFQAQADQHADRLRWAPAIGNGTALIALAGIVGNVPSPDAALSALTWPLAFSAGLTLGVGSLFVSGEMLTLLATGPGENQRHKAEMLRLVGEAKAIVAAVTKENASEQIEAAERLAIKAEQAAARHAKLERKVNRAIWVSVVGAQLNGAAIGMLVFGFTYLLAGHATGHVRLEKPPEVSNRR